jgi:pimeloyl-ACP methyl ester carboxylesterase
MLKGRIMFIWFLLLLVLVWTIFKSGPAPFKTTAGINVIEQVELGGDRQWISIRGSDIHNPVLLFLHGGPGSANLAKLRVQVPELEQHFVVVNWDQRGAGKSGSPGFDLTTLTRQQLVADAHELVDVLKKRFGVEKIYLLGFSWGTVLGLSLVDQYPDDFTAFISVSQVVDYVEGEKLSLNYARQVAKNAGNTQAITELATIEPAYTSPDWYAQLTTERKWLLQFGGVYHTAKSYTHEIWMMLIAPEYSLVEFAFWPASSSNALKQMWPELMKINFFEQVPLVRCPIYFFVGRYDANSPWQLSEAYYQKLNAPAGKHLIWFENSAHDIFFDEPRQLEQQVLKILETQYEP